jgi:methionyl-tRNA formyltransferase
VVFAQETIDVACGEGVLSIEELQLPGGKRLKAKDFLVGKPLPIGTQFS